MSRRFAVAAAALGLLAGCAREAAPPGGDADAELQAAGEAMAAGDPAGRARADSLYHLVLAVNPDQTEARYGLAMVELGENRTWAAQWQLVRVLHVDPGHAGALSKLGLLAYTQGRLEDVVTYLGRLGAERPLAFDESVALADACNKRNRFAQAESLFVSARERFPDSDPENASRILEGLAYARWKQGRLEEAAADLARAVGAGHVTPSTRVMQATVLADLGRPAEARAALPELTYEQARDAGVLADYFVLKNRLLLGTGSDAEIFAGAKELERVADDAPDEVGVPHLLTQMWRRVGDLDAARASAERHAATLRDADRRSDARAESHLMRGATLEADGDLAGALAAYQEGLEVAPENPNLLCAAGGALAALDRKDEAREIFAQLRRMRGGATPAPTFITAGLELRRRGVPKAAARQFELAAARTPGDEEPIYLQALALAEAGEWEEALRTAEPLERPASPSP